MCLKSLYLIHKWHCTSGGSVIINSYICLTQLGMFILASLIYLIMTKLAVVINRTVGSALVVAVTKPDYPRRRQPSWPPQDRIWNVLYCSVGLISIKFCLNFLHFCNDCLNTIQFCDVGLNIIQFCNVGLNRFFYIA